MAGHLFRYINRATTGGGLQMHGIECTDGQEYIASIKEHQLYGLKAQLNVPVPNVTNQQDPVVLRAQTRYYSASDSDRSEMNDADMSVLMAYLLRYEQEYNVGIVAANLYFDRSAINLFHDVQIPLVYLQLPFDGHFDNEQYVNREWNAKIRMNTAFWDKYPKWKCFLGGDKNSKSDVITIPCDDAVAF